jgi:hypothetical protein
MRALFLALICCCALVFTAHGQSRELELDLTVDADLLSMRQQDGKTIGGSATVWFTPSFGLTGEYGGAQECDSIIQSRGLRNGEFRGMGGIAFRAGHGAIRLNRLAVMGGATEWLRVQYPTLGLGFDLEVGRTSYEVLAYGTDRPGKDAWIRTRAGLTLYTSTVNTFGFGGQFINRSFIAPGSVPGVPDNFRFFNTAGGGFVAFSTVYENACFRLIGGAGKGSGPEFDYVEFEVRMTWHL